MRAYFATHLGAYVTAQGLDQRFTEATARFLQSLLNVAFTQVVAADPVAVPLLQRESRGDGGRQQCLSVT